jgi:methionyl-tRNA formyltransferase
VSSSATARVVFAGTPDFSVPTLEGLIGAGVELPFVLTQPDRPAGRGRKLTPSPVKQVAAGHGVPVLQPAAIDAEFRGMLGEEPPDLLVVVAYGLILPQWLLDWPRIAPVNVHASLLPRWRGASPIQQAILAGDEETGVSIMRMTRGVDCGPVYAQRSVTIGPTDTAGELHDRLGAEGASLLVEVLPEILAGTLEPVPQDEAGACLAPKIEKSDALLDWSRPAAELERRVRAFNPWPVAEARTAAGERLRIWAAEALGTPATAAPGTVVEETGDLIAVATARGLLGLKQVQPPGGRIMSARAYLAAHDLRGARFVAPG